MFMLVNAGVMRGLLEMDFLSLHDVRVRVALKLNKGFSPGQVHEDETLLTLASALRLMKHDHEGNNTFEDCMSRIKTYVISSLDYACCHGCQAHINGSCVMVRSWQVPGTNPKEYE